MRSSTGAGTKPRRIWRYVRQSHSNVDGFWIIHGISSQTTSNVVLTEIGWARESRTGEVSCTY